MKLRRQRSSRLDQITATTDKATAPISNCSRCRASWAADQVGWRLTSARSLLDTASLRLHRSSVPWNHSESPHQQTGGRATRNAQLGRQGSGHSVQLEGISKLHRHDGRGKECGIWSYSLGWWRRSMATLRSTPGEWDLLLRSRGPVSQPEPKLHWRCLLAEKTTIKNPAELRTIIIGSNRFLTPLSIIKYQCIRMHWPWTIPRPLFRLCTRGQSAPQGPFRRWSNRNECRINHRLFALYANENNLFVLCANKILYFKINIRLTSYRERKRCRLIWVDERDCCWAGWFPSSQDQTSCPSYPATHCSRT